VECWRKWGRIPEGRRILKSTTKSRIGFHDLSSHNRAKKQKLIKTLLQKLLKRNIILSYI